MDVMTPLQHRRDNLVHRLDDDDWQAVAENASTGMLPCGQSAQCAMVAAGYGRIVGLSRVRLVATSGKANY
jgi:hypothetical protein